MPNPQNVTGKKRSRGRPFTSESAREARQIRTAKDRATASVTTAFKKLAVDIHTNSKGETMQGADIIANSIMQGCVNGNSKLIEIALGLLGETPVKTVNINTPDPGVMEEIRRRMAEADEP